MKKVLFSVLLVFVLAFSIAGLSFSARPDRSAIGDSGWDADYDDWDSDWGSDSDWGGGGSDYGGGSSNRGYSYSTSSDGGGSPNVTGIVLASLFIVVVVIILVVILKKKPSTTFVNRNNQPLPSRAAGIDLAFEKEVGKMAFDYYVEIQKAWMDRDLRPVRSLLTDEMDNMYDMQVDRMLANGRINVMKDFQYASSYVCGRTIANDKETLKVMLSVYCKDYVIDEKTKKVLSGDQWAKLLYYYELTFVKNNNVGSDNHCPNCGALLEGHMSETCPYCGSNITGSSSRYTLSSKKMLKQYKM